MERKEAEEQEQGKKNSLAFSPRRVELDDLVYDRGVAESLADGVAHDLRVAAAGCVCVSFYVGRRHRRMRGCFALTADAGDRRRSSTVVRFRLAPPLSRDSHSSSNSMAMGIVCAPLWPIS